MINIKIVDAECLATTNEMDTAKRLVLKNSKCDSLISEDGVAKPAYRIDQIQTVASLLKGKLKSNQYT